MRNGSQRPAASPACPERLVCDRVRRLAHRVV